ncbi:hypothetical protein FN846DRAFT_976366, partial [Sphaerosporella brunnea]
MHFPSHLIILLVGKLLSRGRAIHRILYLFHQPFVHLCKVLSMADRARQLDTASHSQPVKVVIDTAAAGTKEAVDTVSPRALVTEPYLAHEDTGGVDDQLLTVADNLSLVGGIVEEVFFGVPECIVGETRVVDLVPGKSPRTRLVVEREGRVKPNPDAGAVDARHDEDGWNRGEEEDIALL